MPNISPSPLETWRDCKSGNRPRQSWRQMMHPSRRKELEKLAFGQCLLAGLRGGQVFEDAMTTIPQETLKTMFRINSCSPCTRCRQGKRGDRPRASRRACKPAYEACNRSATTHNRSTTGKRFSSPLLFEILSQRARRRLRLVRQEDPQMLPNIPNYQCGADSADIRLTPANVRFWG